MKDLKASLWIACSQLSMLTDTSSAEHSIACEAEGGLLPHLLATGMLM